MSATTKKYNENSIREAAYYCWQNAGCPNGKDEYFWNMAINQLYGKNCGKTTCSSKSTTCNSKSASCASSKKSTSSTATKKTTTSSKK